MKKSVFLLITGIFILTGTPSFAAGNPSNYPLAVKYKQPPKSHISSHRPIYRPPYRPYYRTYRTGCSSIYISNKNGYTIKQYDCIEPYYISPGVTYIKLGH